MGKFILSILAAALMLASCASGGSGSFAADLPPPTREKTAMVPTDYRIGALDRIAVNVFGEEKLSVDDIQVDASGNISLPLIGPMNVDGKTTSQLAEEIKVALSERYLQSPRVSVLIKEAVSQTVTVAGAVMESGVYPLRGRTTLVEAVAMAKGPDPRLANVKRVVVFRMIEGKRAAAMFDLAAIRDGKAEDPRIYGGDTVIVQGSSAKGFWRELVPVLPGLGVFTLF